MKIWSLAALAAAAFACASCATMIRGTETDFAVDSLPQGALVTLSTGDVCNRTPCLFRGLRRDDAFTVTVSMDGYQTSTTEVTHHWSTEGTLTSVLGGGIGLGVDARSGANQDLSPNPVFVTLQRNTPAVATDTTTTTDATPQPSSGQAN